MGFCRIFWEVRKGIMFSPPIVNDFVIGRYASIGDAKKKVNDNHAMIICEGDSFFIEELDGYVYFNESRIEGKIRLKSGDKFLLKSDKGEVELGIVIEDGLGINFRSRESVFNFICYSFNFPKTQTNGSWFQFDRSYVNSFNREFADETKAEKDVWNYREFREKEKLRNLFKIYFYFNKEYLFSCFERVLRVVEHSGIKKISGKVILSESSFNPDNHESYKAGKVVLYVVGRKEKDLLLSHFNRVNFDSRAYLPNEPLFVRRFNQYIVWNQGGHSIRYAVRDKRWLNYYFFGKNFELIKEERLE